MLAKDIVTPEELKALLAPDGVMDSDAAASSLSEAPGEATVSELVRIVQTMHAQLQQLQEKVQSLERLVAEQQRSFVEMAASAEPEPSPAMPEEAAEPEPETLIPRSEKHGKKKQRRGKFF